jgi:hypothetical protein
MDATPGDPELLNHFSVIVYPFHHDLSGRNRRAHLENLGAHWVPWWSRLEDDQLASALEATSFFLPYIQGLLYPECTRLVGEPPGPRYEEWVDLVRDWSGEGLVRYAQELPRGAVLRLTYRASVRAPLEEFTVLQHREVRGRVVEHTEIPGRLEWIDTLLFPSGIGFLLLKVSVRHRYARLSQLIDLNSALRQVHPLNLSWHLPVVRFQQGGEEVQVRDLMNFLTRGLVSPPDHQTEQLDLFPSFPSRDSLDTAYTDTEAGRAYGERCHLLSYACVALAHLSSLDLPAGAFASGVDRVLFEYAACISLGRSVRDPEWVPAPGQVERVARENRLAMWRCWQGMVLKESCVFLGIEDLGFNRRSLAHNVEKDYLPLYVYTLYQKFQLVAFSNDLMHEVAQVGGGLRGARALLQRFVAFRNQYWFNEVTRKPLGSDLYRILQQGLEIPCLHQMVTSSVKDAKEYYEGVRSRQIQLLRDLLTYGGPLTVALGAVRMLLDSAHHQYGTLVVLLAAGVIGLVLLAARLRSTVAPRRPRRRGTSLAPRPNLSYLVPRRRAAVEDEVTL